MLSEKQLTQALQQITPFTIADAKAEQYVTPPAIAAAFLHEYAEDIQDKTVLDIGAGTGVLGIAALLLGAKKVIFIEQDKDAISILEQNLARINEEYEVGTHIVLHAPLNLTDENADTCVMNPPFGTREAHADTQFLDYALTHACTTLTMHKTSTEEHIRMHVARLGKNIRSEQRIDFVLQNSMKHHTKIKKTIAVTLFRIK